MNLDERLAKALVFTAAAAVLVIEILAGRLMAPYVGVTLESFTGIIGTVLAAIALGNWLGGRAADRRPPVTLIGQWYIAGGLLTVLAPTIVTVAGPGLRGTSPLQIVALTLIAFFAPALALSAVTPAVVAARLDDLTETGQVVGRYGAVGTAGALVGTFVTGFVLVSAVPTRAAMVGVGIVLVVIGGALWARSGTVRRSPFVAVLILGALTLGVRGPCDIETSYSCAFVVADDDRPTGRILWLDNARHSYADLEDPSYLGFRYVRLFADVVSSLPAAPTRVLSIGGGGFTFPRWIDLRFPTAVQTVLEVDGRLADLAMRELGLGEDDVEEILIGDARSTVRATNGPFDLVIADAFGGFVVPWHLTTREFLSDVHAVMSPSGVFVMNVIDRPPNEFVRSEIATLGEVFEEIAVIAPASYFDGTAGGNYVVVASNESLETADIERAIAARGGAEIIISGERLTAWVGDAAVLLDDFAPVDQLITR